MALELGEHGITVNAVAPGASLIVDGGLTIIAGEFNRQTAAT